MNTEIINRLERSLADETRSEITQIAQQAGTTAAETLIGKLLDPALGRDFLKRLSDNIAVEPKTKGEDE